MKTLGRSEVFLRGPNAVETLKTGTFGDPYIIQVFFQEAREVPRIAVGFRGLHRVETEFWKGLPWAEVQGFRAKVLWL